METQNPNQTTATAVTNLEKNIADNVLAKVKSFATAGNLKIAPNFSSENAIKAAWLILQETKDLSKRPALEVCTKESIANALLKMIVLGLNPMKRQCSFIVYGNQLTLQREYQGTIALAKRFGLKSVKANVVYKGDEFAFETNGDTGKKKVAKHIQGFENMDSDILGAYAVFEMADGQVDTELMTMAQIRKSWEQGATKGQSPAHKNFPDQMCMKTVINRALKTIINSSDDADLFAIEDEEGVSSEIKKDKAEEFVAHEVMTNANKTEIGFDEDISENAGVSETPKIEVKETKEVKQEKSGAPGF